MASSGEQRQNGCRTERTFLRTLGRESLAFSSNESINLFPLWKRFLWLGILCVLILTCLVGILVLAFSHFQSTDAQTTQIRTGALIGFGFLLAAVLAWTVFVYAKLGRSCSAPRNERTEGFMALGASAVSTRVRTTIPARCQPPSAMNNNSSTAVSTRLETSIERNLDPTDISTTITTNNNNYNNNNRNISFVRQHEGVRVLLSHELAPVSRVLLEGPRTLIDDRRTMQRFIESPIQLPPPYIPLSLHQEYIQRGYDIITNRSGLRFPPPTNLQYVQRPCREISRIQSDAIRTHIDHCRLSSQHLDGSLHPPPPYRPQDRTSPPPAYDAIGIGRRNTIHSESSNPPSYQSAPSSPVLSRPSETGRSRYLQTSRSPLLHGEEGSVHNEDRSSFLSSSQLSLTQDGDIFVCETLSSLHGPLSPLAQDVQSESCVLSLPPALSLNDDVFHSPGGAINRFLPSRSQTSLDTSDGEVIQQHNARERFNSERSSTTSPRLVREDVSSGPIIYVYLGQAEQR